MSNIWKIRLDREFKEISKLQASGQMLGIVVWTKEGNLKSWEAVIDGPTKTPYEGGKFMLSLEFSDKYPHKPPTVYFQTKIYHPNIDLKTGEICISILKQDWSPALTIEKLLMSISSLLSDPNPTDPLNGEAASTYTINKDKFNKTVIKYIRDNSPVIRYN